MSDANWDVLTAKLRAPDQRESFREACAKHISGQALDTICRIANVSAFVNSDGVVDETKAGKVAYHAVRSAAASTAARVRGFGQNTLPPRVLSARRLPVGQPRTYPNCP